MGFLRRAWRESAPWLYLLWPLALFFRLLATVRGYWQSRGARRLGPQPVIVVGNINLGGSGKTPTLIALAAELRRRGFRPGIISRGYGARARAFPLLATADMDPLECGDEPALIAAATGCPVVVDPDRRAAAAHLLAEFKVDVVLSDDGLQHYRLHRDIEIALVDGAGGLANGLCLPAGPLREPPRRLREVDFVLLNGAAAKPGRWPVSPYRVAMEPLGFRNLASGELRPFDAAAFPRDERLQLVSGIGNPRRFRELMGRLPNPLDHIEFPDHHRFVRADFAGIDPRRIIVMTEKDAVKCRAFARENFWALRAEMDLPREFFEALMRRLASPGLDRHGDRQSTDKHG